MGKKQQFFYQTSSVCFLLTQGNLVDFVKTRSITESRIGEIVCRMLTSAIDLSSGLLIIIYFSVVDSDRVLVVLVLSSVYKM